MDSVDYLGQSLIDGLNLYCYCFNNSINYIDYYGNVPKAINNIIEWFKVLLRGIELFHTEKIADISLSGIGFKILVTYNNQWCSDNNTFAIGTNNSFGVNWYVDKSQKISIESDIDESIMIKIEAENQSIGLGISKEGIVLSSSVLIPYINIEIGMTIRNEAIAATGLGIGAVLLTDYLDSSLWYRAYKTNID